MTPTCLLQPTSFDCCPFLGVKMPIGESTCFEPFLSRVTYSADAVRTHTPHHNADLQLGSFQR